MLRLRILQTGHCWSSRSRGSWSGETQTLRFRGSFSEKLVGWWGVHRYLFSNDFGITFGWTWSFGEHDPIWFLLDWLKPAVTTRKDRLGETNVPFYKGNYVLVQGNWNPGAWIMKKVITYIYIYYIYLNVYIYIHIFLSTKRGWQRVWVRVFAVYCLENRGILPRVSMNLVMRPCSVWWAYGRM